MRWLSNLLSENGKPSTTRFTQVAGLFMAFGIAIIGINKGSDLTGLSILVTAFIVPHTIAKIAQKPMEK